MAISSSSPSFWWETIDDDCPITLEPISSFPYPPFALQEGGRPCYFDGLALSSYIVTQGSFLNPLTREPLTRDDCRRLDHHVETYHSYKLQDEHKHGQQRSVSVAEAFSLRQRISVSLSGQQGSVGEEAGDRRRAEALRNEAAAALCGLFVYTQNRQKERRRGQSQKEYTVPRLGFNLHSAPSADSYIDETDGLRIIDDDEGITSRSDQQAWEELQAAFPKLSTGATEVRDVQQNEAFLRHVRQTAQQLREFEEERKRKLQQSRECYEQEVHRQRQQRKREVEELKRHYAEKQKSVPIDEEELNEALAEIERWRAGQWQKMVDISNEYRNRMKMEEKVKERQTGVSRGKEEGTTTEDVKVRVENEKRNAAAERKKAKAAARRKRARERKKTKKAEELQKREHKQKQLELEAQRAASLVKCSFCGEGMLDAGFEKYAQRFCSTKCARSYKP